MRFVFLPCILQMALAAPIDPSYGTIAAQDLSNNLAIINQNMYNGMTSLADPLFKFAIDTAPNLAHLYAISNGVNVPPFLAKLAKSVYGATAVAAGRLAGGAAVLGSSVAESSMRVGSHGLQAAGEVVQAAGSSGIDLAGRLGDHLASGTSVGAEILSTGLKTTGDAMLVGSVGVNEVTQGISGVIDAIGERLVAAITSLRNTASRLPHSDSEVSKDSALQLSKEAQQSIYPELVMVYSQILTHVQNLFNLLASNIFGLASSSGSTFGLGLNATSASINVPMKSL